MEEPGDFVVKSNNFLPFFSIFVFATFPQNTVTPFSPIRSHPGSAHSSSAGSSETHPLALNNIISSGSGRSSDIDYSRQTSEMSVASAEASLNDPALLKSLTKFQRFVAMYIKNIIACLLKNVLLILCSRDRVREDRGREMRSERGSECVCGGGGEEKVGEK